MLWLGFDTEFQVLILVLMEYGLRVIQKEREMKQVIVLILVLMEYGLRGKTRKNHCQVPKRVLILVLMEYGLRAFEIHKDTCSCSRLNPCFNGIWSKRV